VSIVTWTKEETVAILSMNNGENRHNLEFTEVMSRLLDEIATDMSIEGLVLTSSDEKNFSQGMDVKWIETCLRNKELDQIKRCLYGMNGIFKKLMLIPMPTIAAVNGHAYGNGAILSCACDFRFMRLDRGFFCFPEADLGIPFFHGMNAILKKAVPYYKLVEMQFSGNRYTAPELERHHVIVQACAGREELMTEAVSYAGSFHKKRGVLGEMKKRMYRDIIEAMDKLDPLVSIEPLDIMIPG
jgi:enoyl-CoA hydratase/carnithine racemase